MFHKRHSSGTPSTLYSSANRALLDQCLPTVLLSSLKHRLVGATDWSSFGNLSFLHQKKKYFISHPSQRHLNGCAKTKIIQWCLLHIPITNRFLPILFYKLIYTGSAWKENKIFLYWLKEGAKLEDFQSSLGHWYHLRSMKSHISKRCVYLVFARLRANVLCPRINSKSSCLPCPWGQLEVGQLL